MKTRRLHTTLWVPDNFDDMKRWFWEKQTNVEVSYHAAGEMLEDRHTIIPVPTIDELCRGNPVEIYERMTPTYKPTGDIHKMVIRVPSEKYDFSYVMSSDGIIVSAWTNVKNDEPKLVKKRYYIPKWMK